MVQIQNYRPERPVNVDGITATAMANIRKRNRGHDGFVCLVKTNASCEAWQACESRVRLRCAP